LRSPGRTPRSPSRRKPRNKAYDATVDATRPVKPDDSEAERMFKEMKRREF